MPSSNFKLRSQLALKVEKIPFALQSGGEYRNLRVNLNSSNPTRLFTN